MPHNLCLQCTVTDVTHRRIDYVCCQVVTIEHVEGTVRDVLDRLVIVGSGVELGAIVSSGECESTYNVQIGGHVYLDVPRWCQDAVLVGDGERDEVFAHVVDESLGGLDGYRVAICC